MHDVQSVRGVRNPARSQNARFSLAHRLAATFPGAGNASRKPETTVTEATTAGRGDYGEVHNGRGRVGPRGLNRPPCSTKSKLSGLRVADCRGSAYLKPAGKRSRARAGPPARLWLR